MDELIPLRNATLGSMSGSVRVPRYDRAALSPGIVHIGLGNFHRAHQSWYLHRLMDQGQAMDWAIVGAGIRPQDATQRAKLLEQDGLTTLIERSPGEAKAEIVGSMVDFLPVEEGNGALIAGMADPRIRIVSLTVTEGGYYRTATGAFDADHPDILHDAAHPEAPCTAFGAMIAALRRRRDSGAGPFTGLSCDNLQGNGAILRRTIVSLAELSDTDLAGWIDEHCRFPNSMVDCIVPATGEAELALARRFGIDDRAPVTHEPFRQWVIEDDFCAGRPDWDAVGATFSNTVPAYEKMKLRILNAGHQLLANAGEILSVPTIAGCITHPAIGAFFRTVEHAEIAPHVPPVPDWSAEEYVSLIERRFANEAIVDTTRRVAFDGSARHPGFLHPTIRDRLAANQDIEGLALAEALWARMCLGRREDGSTIEPNDPHWSDLQAAAEAARTRPIAWLEQKQIYGSLGHDERLAVSFDRWLSRLYDEGVALILDGFAAKRPAEFRM